MSQMDPIDVVHDIVKKGNPRLIAEACGISVSLLYKMGETGEQHRTNFLEAFLRFYRASKNDRRLIECVCHEGNMFPVANSPALPLPAGETLAEADCRLEAEEIKLKQIRLAARRAGGYTAETAGQFRRQTERMKSELERMARAIDQGRLRKKITAWLFTLWPTVEALTELSAACG